MANKLDVKINLPSDAELKRMFDAVPILERYGVSDKVVRAGAKPIVDRARKLAPRSASTGSTELWSKKMFVDGGTGGTPRSRNEKPLWKTIKLVVRKYSRAAAISVIGPEWPDGNKVFFNVSNGGRKQVLWGKRTGRTIPAIRNWIVQAFDETKTQQLSLMKAKLRSLMDDIWRSR